MSEFPDLPGYKIEKQLGQGGMATVYLAVQESFGRQVALKVMSDRLGEDNVWAKRFIHEAQVVAQLSHPNIIPVFDVGTHNNQFYISMEFMKGGNLPDKMSSGIPVPQALKIIAGVAAGLDFAGEKGFVHRDIKPDNIMFRENGSPVILDFGIVKQLNDAQSKMTQTGTIVGTTTYMSPEQAMGRDLDHRSDIYSLGIMFYELLTGSAPFRGDSAVAVLFKHVNEEAPPLPAHLSALQPLLDTALAKNPDDRYSRAREMIEHMKALEQDIKAMLRQQKVTNPNIGTNDATVIQSAPNVQQDQTQLLSTDDYTQVLNRTDKTQVFSRADQETEEHEITQVLSSAQATIKDFSAEARQKRAKRTRAFLMGVSCVAVLAVCYVGYQQFYIVPKEKAAAEERIRAVAEKTQNKLKLLHAQAQKLSQGLTFEDLNAVDKVIALYREILKIDSDNTKAQQALYDMGEEYVALANRALTDKNVNAAESFRDYAQQLYPQHAGLASLRDALNALRAESVEQELGDKFKQDKINTLITLAQRDIDNSADFSQDAYTKLQQVLHLAPEHKEAQNLIQSMLQALEKNTRKNIEQGRLSKAQLAIGTLKNHHYAPDTVNELQNLLSTEKQKVNKESAVSNLIAQASRLKREKRSLAINDELREIYLDILDLDKRNKTAKRGLDDTSRFDASVAEKAILNREFSRAQEQINIIKKYTPRYPSLGSLNEKLKTTQQAAEVATQKLQEARDLISSANNNDSRSALKNALDLVNEVKLSDPENPRLPSTISTLETAYISAITPLISEGETETLEHYFTDALSTTWPSDRILQLQLTSKSSEKGKTKKKRVIVGGF